MAIKKWSCKLLKIFSSNKSNFLSRNYSNKGMHTTTTKGRSFRTNLKWAYKDKFELFVFITSNKDKCKSNKILKAMMGGTKAQLPK
jgi:hypothetical protein